MTETVGYVSLGVGVFCLAAGFLFWWFGNHAWPKATLALVITGSVGLMGSQIGQWLQNLVGMSDRLASSLVGQFTGVAVTGLIALAIVAFVFFRLRQNRIDDSTLYAAAAVPPAATLIPGIVGQAAMTVITIPASLIGAAIGWLFGLM